MGFVYIALTIAFTVYGQLVIKWQVARAGALPAAPTEKLLFLGQLLLNPWIASGLIAAFVASLFWMAALTKYPLSFAYPFMSLSFVGTVLLSSLLFYEVLNPAKWVGLALLIVGVIVASQEW